MSLGMSGAKFTVVKTGEGVAAQGRYIQWLNARCLPQVLAVDSYSYEMEFLFPPQRAHPESNDTYRRVIGMLMEDVWCLPAADLNTAWLGELDTWLTLRKAPELLRHTLHALYPTWNVQTHAIHGDPTLANIMQRQDGTWVLCDPLPPGGKIPSIREVDLGKLLQSGCGWEDRLRRHTAPQDSWQERTTAWIGMFHEYRRRAWFWCAVHLWRVEPYADRANRIGVAAWAKDIATIICDKELR